MSNYLQPARLLCPWIFLGKNANVGCHSLLHWIFLTQELDSGLLHYRQILYHLSHQETPWISIKLSSVTQSCPTLWTLWTASHQASLSVTNSQSLLKLMSIESVMPSNHLILCHPLLLLPSIFPNIRVFSNELALCIRWPKYWSFSFSISPSNEQSGLISSKMD